MGSTVYAGVKLYQIYMEKNGAYGVHIVVEPENAEENTVLPDKVPEIEIKTGYLPEGMIQRGDVSKTTIEYENAPAKGGITMTTVLLDTDESKVAANDTYVVSSELLSFDGHDGVYLERKIGDEAEIVFDKKICLVYPEVRRVLIMEVANNVTKEEALKLVHITLEYKNTGDETLNDILFFGSLSAIRKDADTYELIDYYNHYGEEEWNYRTGSSVARLGEMPCHDVGGKEGKNYISSLNPGESAVVHMAWIVNETDLDEIYLNLNVFGEAAFDEESLEIGYVDIRQ